MEQTVFDWKYYETMERSLKGVYMLRVMLKKILQIWEQRRLIMDLAKNDFKTRYVGSYFGILWAFIQPVVTILVFWFVFEVGFRSSKIEGVPFILWFSCGIIPWFFFADAWINITNCFLEYSYLVKKVVFQISILPIIKIFSSLFVHVFFVLFLVLLFILHGYTPSAMWLQLVYYIFCNIMFVVSLGFLTASIVPFLKDLSQLINITIQFGMWLTPVMWQYTAVPEQYHWLFALNPMFYIVEGFRDCLIGNVGLWVHWDRMLVFWGITVIIFVSSIVVFKKLKPHFADIL